MTRTTWKADNITDQSGRRISIVGQGIAGSGDITGRDLQVTLRDEDDIVYRGYYRISADAKRISGHYIDSIYNEKIPITARRIETAGRPGSGSDEGISAIRNIR